MIGPRLLTGSLALVVFLSACQHSAITPSITQASIQNPASLFPMAALDLTLDTATLEFSVEPIRTSTALGDKLTLDATAAFGPLFRVTSISRQPDGIQLELGIRHPIPLPDPDNPRPGDRLDLHAFDVLGIAIFDGAAGIEVGGERIVPHWVANADGYTGLLHESVTAGFETSATVHPYIMLSEETGPSNFVPGSETGWADVYAPTGHNVLPQGAPERVTTMALALPAGIHRIRLAAQATIQHAATFAHRMDPIYALPEGNQAAPIRIDAEVMNNLLIPGDAESTAAVWVEVFDWQQFSAVDTNWDPNTAPASVRKNSTLERSRVYVPDLGHESSAPGGTPCWSEGTTGIPGSRADHIIRNNAGAGAGTYTGFIKAIDQHPSGVVYGRDSAPITIDEYATWQVFDIEIRKPSATPRLERIEVAPHDEIFIGPGAGKQLKITGYYADDTTAELPDGDYELLDPAASGVVVTLADSGLLTRDLPRDSSALTVARTVVDTPDGPFYTRLVIYAGDPYADAINNYNPACGASGSGADTDLCLGGPQGAGPNAGSTHTTSLGYGGSLTVVFLDGGVIDEPGDDFIVFENAFAIGQDPDSIFTETCQVEVSADGETWYAFPMDYTPDGALPWRRPWNFAGMAGVTPVLANVEENSIDPQDPAAAGGDAFDLADVGIAYAKYVRLTSTGLDPSSVCTMICEVDNRLTDSNGDLIDDEGKHATCSGSIGGPDIDAIAIIAGHQGTAP